MAVRQLNHPSGHLPGQLLCPLASDLSEATASVHSVSSSVISGYHWHLWGLCESPVSSLSVVSGAQQGPGRAVMVFIAITMSSHIFLPG